MVGVSRGTVVVMGLGVLLGIGDGAFNEAYSTSPNMTSLCK